MKVPTRTARTMTAIAIVSRARVPVPRSLRPSPSSIGLKAVPHRPDRLDRRGFLTDSEPPSQVSHVDPDDPGIHVVRVSPHRAQQFALRQHLPWMPHEERQQVELGGGEADLNAGSLDPAADEVHAQVAELE